MWKSDFAKLLTHQSVGATAFAEASALKASNLPPALYRFQGFSRQCLDALNAHNLWVASPSSFNDPFDSAVFFSMAGIVEKIRTDRDSASPRGKSRLVRLIQGEYSGVPYWIRDPLVKQITNSYRKVTGPLARK